MNVIEANLAYGFDLGTADGFLVKEVDDGALTASWFDTNMIDDFPEQVYQRLYAAIPGTPVAAGTDEHERTAQSHFGAKIALAGTFDAPRYILAMIDSGMSAEYDDAFILDLDKMRSLPKVSDWDARLAVVLAVLGLTPLQAQPKWLIFPCCY